MAESSPSQEELDARAARKLANLRAQDVYDGILLVDKPSGPTSHDIVDLLRRQFKFDKVGHGGTLDPQATGLLIMLIGRGTKLSNMMMSSDKAYEGTLQLGIETDSQDAQGEVIREADPSGVTREQVEACMQARKGDQYQTPPMVSAVKKGGKPLYKLARKGKTVEREPRLIHVYDFSMLTWEPPQAEFRLRCTKGTYVRTLCHDIGEELGCGGMLAALRRSQSGDWSVDQALPLDRIEAMSKEELLEHIVPIHKVVMKAHEKG